MPESLEHLDGHQPQAARADHGNPFLFRDGLELGNGRISRQPRAGQRRRPGGVNAARIHQVLGMRDQQVIRIAAGKLDADPARRHAMIIHALSAARAFSATNPGTDQAVLTDRRIRRARSRSDHGTEGLMAERDGRSHAALAHVETLAATQVEIAFADMHVAVADAAVFQLQQHFRPGRLRRRLLGFLQRLAPFDHVVTQHCSPLKFYRHLPRI